jgi:hypothetical protein
MMNPSVYFREGEIGFSMPKTAVEYSTERLPSGCILYGLKFWETGERQPERKEFAYGVHEQRRKCNVTSCQRNNCGAAEKRQPLGQSAHITALRGKNAVREAMPCASDVEQTKQAIHQLPAPWRCVYRAAHR